MRLQRFYTSAYISFSHLFIRCSDCSAFRGANHGLSQPRNKESLASMIHVDKQLNRPSTTTSLLSKQDDEGEDNKDRQTNKLDIFGQPNDDDSITKRKNKKAFEETEIQGPDRIKSCIPYVLPLIDGDSFGAYIYDRIPPLGMLDYVLLRPIVEGFEAVPILSILLFVAFALGPRLTDQSREVRFNAQQAILIDVSLIIPQLIGGAVADADANLPRAVMEPCSNFVWFGLFSMVIYCVVSNLRGKRPDQIPFISGAADYAIGPF
mmetsp:Transcript_28325/g.59032  ORF Transcript_28325/g.59032 Transcript_28325/m.59032 type:complete len:264 (-) Transcript_28325:169-960(-)